MQTRPPFTVRTVASATVATKLAKHLALLACLAIVGRTAGRAAIEPLAIFLLVLLAAALHSVGRLLAWRDQRAARRRFCEP